MNFAGSDLSRMVAVITGGGGDIGTAVARSFVEHGATVVVCDADLEAAQRTASDLADGVRAMRLDVTDGRQVEAAVAEVLATSDSIDVLVNAAGILGRTPLELTPTLEEWDEVFAVNARGTYAMVRAVAPAMISQQSGAIVNFSSVAAKEGRETFLPYGASKAAVLNLTWSAARVLAPHHVTVNAVCPGPVDGRMWTTVAAVVDRESGVPAGTAKAKRESELPTRQVRRACRRGRGRLVLRRSQPPLLHWDQP